MGITYLHILQVSEGPHIKIRDILCSGAVIELTVAAADGLRVDSLCAAQRRRAVQTSHMRRRAKLCNAQETRHFMSQHACSQTLTPIKHTHTQTSHPSNTHTHTHTNTNTSTHTPSNTHTHQTHTPIKHTHPSNTHPIKHTHTHQTHTTTPHTHHTHPIKHTPHQTLTPITHHTPPSNTHIHQTHTHTHTNEADLKTMRDERDSTTTNSYHLNEWKDYSK